MLKDDTMPDPLTDRLRAICLALPEAVEKEAWGDPIFRVRGKIFGMEKRGDGRVSLWCKAPAGSQMVLIGADPKRFFAPPYVGPKGWVGVRLDDGPDLRRGGRAGPPQLLADRAEAARCLRRLNGEAPLRRTPARPSLARLRGGVRTKRSEWPASRPRCVTKETMAASLEDALKRLDGAVGQLEAAVNRRLEVERRRGDLETELQIMQDDRARLAVELDSATARLNRTESAARDVGERVQRAVDSIQDVLANAEEDPPKERT